MIQIVSFQITADGATHSLNSYSNLQGLDKCAQIRIEPVRGSVSNPAYVIGPNGATMHQILAPVVAQPLDYWASTPNLPKGNLLWLPSISFRGTSGDQFNVTVAVR
jgi:hypothetical protein